MAGWIDWIQEHSFILSFKYVTQSLAEEWSQDEFERAENYYFSALIDAT